MSITWYVTSSQVSESVEFTGGMFESLSFTFERTEERESGQGFYRKSEVTVSRRWRRNNAQEHNRRVGCSFVWVQGSSSTVLQ